MGQKLLARIGTIVTPETLFRWYRELVALQFTFDGLLRFYRRVA